MFHGGVNRSSIRSTFAALPPNRTIPVKQKEESGLSLSDNCLSRTLIALTEYCPPCLISRLSVPALKAGLQRLVA
ncbi:hypothetical protein BaRGS_00032830 [Batillaria attramentaria]|uniref:Uncharacterized protein n=1 Tax=Batillaria attramentaria TaxID=370345 RepID=A0ABD0JM24_9CAEN